MGQLKQSIINNPQPEVNNPDPEDFALWGLRSAIDDVERFPAINAVDELKELRARLDTLIQNIEEA